MDYRLKDMQGCGPGTWWDWSQELDPWKAVLGLLGFYLTMADS